MKKSWLIIAGISAVIVAAIAYVALTGDKVSSPEGEVKESSAQTQPSTPTPAPEAPATTPGTYKAYAADMVADDTGRKVLFFHAPWCPQCRELEQSIQAGTIPDGVTIYKVDFDTSHALRTKYGVNLQTTLVEIDNSGTEIKKYVAYSSPTLEATIKGLGLK